VKYTPVSKVLNVEFTRCRLERKATREATALLYLLRNRQLNAVYIVIIS